MKLKVTVNGTVYDVAVDVEEEPKPTLGALVFGNGAPKPSAIVTGPSHVSTPASEEKVLRAPISGTVNKVVVEPGAAVESGAVLLVLEAMKMETEITAPGAGTVADITVAPGDAVAGGQILIHWA
ncbi:MAG TPA: biotin/lipoyl-containing protein [Kineosporiaceae bacterium]|nr:biotin/lipoyl-containing protein [Kineosporiaceae bacterium]